MNNSPLRKTLLESDNSPKLNDLISKDRKQKVRRHFRQGESGLHTLHGLQAKNLLQDMLHSLSPIKKPKRLVIKHFGHVGLV